MSRLSELSKSSGSSEHLSTEVVARYRDRSLSPEQLLLVDEHIRACEACRHRLAEAEGLSEASSQAFMDFQADLQAADREPDHLSYEQMEGFVDEQLDDKDREVIESHIALCPECAADVLELSLLHLEITTRMQQEPQE